VILRVDALYPTPPALPGSVVPFALTRSIEATVGIVDTIGGEPGLPSDRVRQAV